MSMSVVTAAATLTECLELAQTPIAVCFTDSLPAGVRLFEGRVPAGCRFWQEAARSVFATAPRDHDLCSLGTYTHNLATTPSHEADRREAFKTFALLGYVREEDLPHIPVLKNRPEYVLYGPLAQVPLLPDVVMLMVASDQQLILSEAAQQMEGGLPPAMGRPACGVVPQAINSGRAALSLGCCGARAYLDVMTPDVALFAVPGSRLLAFTERVAALARANAVLTTFHRLRRQDVEAGGNPTVKESLAAHQVRG
jgi:uncharacterized protein (DUF169 family)